MSENKDGLEGIPPAPASSASSDNNSPTSTTTIQKTEVTRPSSLPKPSGLKPPTKIGRLCSNSAPKPAVPISPRTATSCCPEKLQSICRQQRNLPGPIVNQLTNLLWLMHNNFAKDHHMIKCIVYDCIKDIQTNIHFYI